MHSYENLHANVRARTSDRAIALVDDSLAWDMTLPWVPGYADPDTLQRFKRAGFKVISLTVGGAQDNLDSIIRWTAAVRKFISENSGEMTFCKSVKDIDQARADGKLALIFHMQETLAYGHDLNLVQALYDLGIRHTLLVYNAKNLVGDGCAERTDAGLSRWGIKLIQEMNRIGMLVCGTHTGHKTTMEAMEVATAPFVFTHSNAYAVHPHFRNIKDDQIKACAATGGVIGINGLGEFLNDHEATSESMFRHIDYIANLVGPRHVGIGLDYVRDYENFWQTWVIKNDFMWPQNEGQVRTFSKFSQPEQLLEITDLMIKSGYSDSDVHKILGENFRRVAEAVWK